MTFEEVLNDAADVALCIGFIFFAAFWADYVLIRPFRGFEPWWRSPIGWMFATLSGAVVIMGGLVLAALLIGPGYWGRPGFRFFGYAGFAIAAITLCVVYFSERGSAEPVLFHKRKRFTK